MVNTVFTRLFKLAVVAFCVVCTQTSDAELQHDGRLQSRAGRDDSISGLQPDSSSNIPTRSMSKFLLSQRYFC